MSRKKSFITVTDQFCGAGGSSIGATKAGAELRLALNHWQLAIDTHNTNFPKADHDCTDISACDPRRYPSTDILITSPECFPAGTLILTSSGMVPIEEVGIGDWVWTHLNRWRPVVRLQSRIADTVIVRGQGHSVGIEVTPNHRFWMREQKRKWNNEKRDYDRHVYSAPGWAPIEGAGVETWRWATPTDIRGLSIPSLPSDLVYADTRTAWWVIGRWLGDGSLTFGKNSEVIISCGFHEVDELTAPLERTGSVWRRQVKRTAVNFSLWSASLRDWLFLHFGHGAAHKRLPAWVYSLRADQRQALLDGYISADGHVSERRTRADSVSRRLALGLRLLAESLGYRTGLYRYEQHATRIEGRDLNVLPIWALAWENNASSRAAFEEDGHSWGLVKSVVPGRQGVEVFNLEVEEDHSYVAEGVVVANCTNHTLAKGVARRRQSQLNMFGGVTDPAEERSRATMWDVPRFAEYHQYRMIVVENVIEARWWVMWDAWLHAMDLLGYAHQCVHLNSMHAHPTPQSRDRMYVVFWRKDGRKPDLTVTARAWCPRCEHDVQSVQAWKPGRSSGRYRKQYDYRCPDCRTVVEPYYYAAANAIDWSIPAQRIGDRTRPLREKTIQRIQAGLDRFGAQPHVFGFYTRPAGVGAAISSIQDALPTLPSRPTHALITPPQPYIVDLHHDTPIYSVDRPLPTQTARQTQALVMPFLTSYYGSGQNSSCDGPMPTVTTKDRHALVVPPFIVNMQAHSGATAMHEPIRTILTGPHKYLVQPGEAAPPAVDDCGFRMLAPAECGRGMGFPASYRVLGGSREQIKQYGNAVTPPAMELLMQRCMEALR